MITGNKVAPTSTVLQARVALFQPSQRPQHKKGQWINTKYGKCRVTGRLGQRHADVLEGILYVAERRRDMDEAIELLVDPSVLRKILSDRQYSYEGIQNLIADLRGAVIEIVTPEMEKTGDRIIGGLIDFSIPSPMTRPDPLTGGERHLWRVRLGIALIMLLNRDLHLHYQPAPLARLKHGVSQAVARHVLTHKNTPTGGWHTDTLIQAAYGNKCSSQQLRNARRRLKEDSDKLSKIGIHLDKKRIKRATTAR